MFLRCFRYTLCCIVLLLSLNVQAGKKTRILFLLDASSSMTYPWNSTYSRFNVASNILLHIIDSVYAVNNEVEFAVRAYGSVHPAQEHNCTDTRLEVPFNFQNVMQIKTRLQFLQPVGFSPIAYSLEQASKNELSEPSLYDYSIIFITDGGESCDGDICATFSKFLKSKISIQPYVIGLDKNEKLKSYYDCMGNFLEVSTAEDIPKAVDMIVAANRKILDKPKVMNLSTTTSKTEVIKDTVKKVLPLPPLKKDEMYVLDFSRFPFKVSQVKLTAKPQKIVSRKATLRFDWEEPIKKEIDKALLTALQAHWFEPSAKEKLKSKAKNKLWKNTKKAVLRFDWEEEIARVTDVYPRLRSKDFGLKKYEPKAIKAKPWAYKNTKKARLKFDWEEPIVRVNDIYPMMKVGRFLETKKKDKLALIAKKKTYKNKTAAVVRIQYEEPVVRYNKELVSLVPHSFTKTKKADKISVIGKVKKMNLAKKATLRFEYEVLKKENILALRFREYPKRTGYAMALPSRKYGMIKERPTLRFTFEQARVVAKNDTALKSKPKPKPNNATDPMKYDVKTESSAETQIQIFLVGEDGRDYPKAQPMIQILNPVTKDTLYRFARTVEGGKPKIENIKPGTYDVIIKEYNVASAFNVKIEPNKINKVTLTLRNGTLYFAYTLDLFKPVKYNAVVIKRFADRKNILQRCTDVLKYEPGQYYVEVNTLPVFKQVIFIDYFVEYCLRIRDPGTVQFTNTSPLGKVSLQCVLGDSFATFYDLTINGKIQEQTLELLPGIYKAIIPLDPKMPLAGSKTVDFKVESNKNTLVELR